MLLCLHNNLPKHNRETRHTHDMFLNCITTIMSQSPSLVIITQPTKCFLYITNEGSFTCYRNQEFKKRYDIVNISQLGV